MSDDRSTQDRSGGARRSAYTNVALSAIAVLLAAHLAQNSGLVTLPSVSVEREATAQTSREATGGIINPADQRRSMIRELQSLNERLGRVESALKGPIEVSVVRMPAEAPAERTARKQVDDPE